MIKQATTLGELIKSGYQSKSIKDEIRQNLIKKIAAKKALPLFVSVNSCTNFCR